MSGRHADRPDLLVIGAQKAGTSWLHEMFADRADCWVPPFKELHFFDHKFCPENRRWTRWHVKKGLRDARARLDARGDLDAATADWLDRIGTPPFFNGTWYRGIFAAAPPDRFKVDVTPEYCAIGPDGIAFVAKFLKSARFLYLIRDPLDRALSQLRMNVSRKQGKGSPPDLAAWQAAANDPVIASRGDYAAYIPAWDAAFGADRMLYLPYGRIARDPGGLMAEIEAFTGLPPAPYPRLRDRIHVTDALPVPKNVRDMLAERVAPQRAFLDERFGAGFTRDI
ncbi:sulfotransferase [Oceanomicrobium pacificus]|uniref:Sulfotransferase n=1 Tax=Oceanomicrobium pacificus TaxID=2692916 RepID=A0A6B0TYV4_9RHOB|nr:sulfotransferase [Oceanomicrobium pacificus]MXU66204.1 sulfotransferase [Oceanomicrobium pacificus]